MIGYIIKQTLNLDAAQRKDLTGVHCPGDVGALPTAAILFAKVRQLVERRDLRSGGWGFDFPPWYFSGIRIAAIASGCRPDDLKIFGGSSPSFRIMKKFNYAPFNYARNRCYFNECTYTVVGTGVAWALHPIFRFVDEFVVAFCKKQIFRCGVIGSPAWLLPMRFRFESQRRSFGSVAQSGFRAAVC